MKDYVALATAYAQSVVDGTRAACKWERLACQRHFRDLQRAEIGRASCRERVSSPV